MSQFGGGGKGPPTVVCYICGREFGRSSIHIHEPQCAKKFEDEQALKPPHERKPLPRRPQVAEGASREEWNDAAKEAYEAKVMAHCPGCGRTFKDQATLQRHLKACKVGAAAAAPEGARGRNAASSPSPGGPRGGPAAAGETDGFRKPRTVVCYICGREFGTSSIAIHEPQCAKKFEAEQAQKPPHERKPLPRRPDVCDGASREEYNRAAEEAYEAKVMAHCPRCGRSFKDEATLARHAKSCKGAGAGGAGAGSAMDPAAEARLKAFEAQMTGGGGAAAAADERKPPAAPRTMVCYICGREFGTASIAIHEPQCAKKFLDAEALKPPHERRPLPTKPELPGEGASREEYNEAAKEAYEAKVMAHCPNCGRSFKDEATLARHLKSCKVPPPGQDSDTGRPSTSGGSRAGARARSGSRSRAAANAAPGRPSTGGPEMEGATPQMPRMVVCYICGREFGRASIGIHEPQCAKKWEETEALKPPHERKPLPQRPDVSAAASREEYNEAAKGTHEAEAMAHCAGCGRTFKDEETLARHAKACKALAGLPDASSTKRGELPDHCPPCGPGAAARGGSGRGDSKGPPQGPRMVVCYICGREFGRSSIGIHEPQCAKKFLDAEAQKPPNERRPLPQKPEVAKGASREEWNEAAAAAYEDKVMVHCDLCGRSFKDEDTLRRHQKACKGPRGSSKGPQSRASRQAAPSPPPPPARPSAQEAAPDSRLAEDSGQPTGPRTVVCYICGREFGRASIGIHEKQCAKKFEDLEAQKPPEQRRPLPERPQLREGATREEHNAAAQAAYESQVMVPCPACGRTFKDEATLARHAKACKGAPPDRGRATPDIAGRGSIDSTGERGEASTGLSRAARPPSARSRSGVLSSAGRLAMG